MTVQSPLWDVFQSLAMKTTAIAIEDHHTDDIKHLMTVKDLILMFSFVGQRLKSFWTSTEKILDSNRFWRGKTRNCFLPSSSAHWRSGTRRTECVWGRWDECLRTGTWSLHTTVNWFPVTVNHSVDGDTICPYVWPNAKGSVEVCLSMNDFQTKEQIQNQLGLGSGLGINSAYLNVFHIEALNLRFE